MIESDIDVIKKRASFNTSYLFITFYVVGIKKRWQSTTPGVPISGVKEVQDPDRINGLQIFQHDFEHPNVLITGNL